MSAGRTAFWVLTWTLLTAAALASAFDALPAPVPVRALVALAFVAVVPGFGWVRLLAPAAPLTALALTLALSLSLSLLVAFTMAVASAWSAAHGALVLASLGAFGVLAWLAYGRATSRESQP
jgi:uncharacterized membrane protein